MNTANDKVQETVVALTAIPSMLCTALRLTGTKGVTTVHDLGVGCVVPRAYSNVKKLCWPSLNTVNCVDPNLEVADNEWAFMDPAHPVRLVHYTDATAVKDGSDIAIMAHPGISTEAELREYYRKSPEPWVRTLDRLGVTTLAMCAYSFDELNDDMAVLADVAKFQKVRVWSPGMPPLDTARASMGNYSANAGPCMAMAVLRRHV